MSHGQQKRVVELFSDRSLDLGVGRKVDTRSGLVQDDNRAPTEQRPCHRDQLTLPV